MMKRKEVDDVMGGEGAWDNVDQTEGEGTTAMGIEETWVAWETGRGTSCANHFGGGV